MLLKWVGCWHFHDNFFQTMSCHWAIKMFSVQSLHWRDPFSQPFLCCCFFLFFFPWKFYKIIFKWNEYKIGSRSFRVCSLVQVWGTVSTECNIWNNPDLDWADDKLVAVCDNKGLITEHILQAERDFSYWDLYFPRKDTNCTYRARVRNRQIKVLPCHLWYPLQYSAFYVFSS